MNNKEYYIRLNARLNDSQKTITDLNTQIKNLQNKVSSLEIKVKMPTNTNKGFTDLDTQLKKLKVSMSDFEGNVLSTRSTFDTITTRYTDNAGKMLTVTEKMINGQKQYKASLKEVNSAVETNAKQADQWRYSWSKAFQSFTTYMSVTQVFYTIKNTIIDMINEVTELDSALVELQKVSSLTGSGLQNFVNDAYEAAEGIAKTGTEMVSAATEFAKAGYSESEILKLGEVALMYTNIADEAVSASEASEFMIAQMKAFNIEAEDSMHIIDAVNEVANKYAVSSADIANNLGASSAVMANAGNSYEQMIGLLTAGTEITRNASKVANGLKTITLRMQGMDDEGETNLELVAQMEQLYSKLGISVYNSNGELKNTFELLETLAPIYQEATAAEKAYITETIAGKYQAQNAAAILNNFSTAVSATETALNSQGSAVAENEKVLGSIKGKLSQLSSQFEELAQKVIGSDIVKFFIDLGTTLLEVANSGFGQFIFKSAALNLGIQALIAIVGGAITTFGKMQSFFVSISNTIGNFNNLLNVMQNRVKLVALKNNVMTQSLQKTKIEMAALGLATDKLNSEKEAQIAINNALKASTLALNIALSAGSMLIMGAITLYQNYQQAQKQAIEESLSEAEELDQKTGDLDSTIDKIKELRTTIDNNNTGYSESVAAREELNEIQKQLINDYGLEADAIDLTTGSIDKQIEALKNLRKESAQDWLDSNVSEINTAEDKIYGSKGLRTSYSTNGTKVLGITPRLGGGINKWDGNILGLSDEEKKAYEEKKEFYDQYLKDYEKIMSKYGKVNKNVDNKDGSLKSITFNSKNIDAEKKAMEEWKDYLTKNKEEILASGIMSEDEFDSALGAVNSNLNKIKENFGQYFDLLDAANKKKLTASGFSAFEEELKNMANESVLTEDSVQKLIDKYPNLNKALQESGYSVDQIIKDYQNYNNVVDKIGEELGSDFTDSIMEMIATNDLSYESFNKLLDKYPELQDYLDKYQMSISDYADKISSLVQVQMSWDTALQNFNSSIDTLQGAFSTLLSAQEEYNENGYISIDTLQSLLALDSEYLGYLIDENGQLNLNRDAFQNLAKAKINDLIATEEQRHYNAVLEISQQKLNNTTKQTIGWFQTLWNVIKGGKVSVSETTKTLGQLEAEINKQGTEAQKAALAAENETYENRMAVLKSALAGLEKNFESSFGGSSSSYSGSSGSGSRGSSSSSASSGKEWWETEFDKLKEQFDYNEITIEQYINGLSNLLGKVEQGTEAWRKINEELQKQRLTKVEDDYKRGTISLDEYIAKLKELIKAYKQGTEAWNELADKIKEGLQDKLDKQKDDLETAESAAVSIIDKEIEKLEDLRDAEEERYDKLIEQKEKANEETERELELARLQEALENAKKEKTKRVWREGIGWVWEADQEAIKDAEEALDEFNREQEINDLEEEKDNALAAIDEQIKGWEDYKDAWESVVEDYEFEQDRLILLQQLGAKTENEILQQKIDAINRYKDAYLSTMKEIEELENTPADKLSGYSTPSSDGGSSSGGGASSNKPSLTKGSYVSIKSGTRWYSTSYGGTSGAARSGTIKYVNEGATYPYNIDGLGWVKKTDIEGYKHGGVVDYTGLAMLHGTKNKPEYVLNNDQMKNLLAYMTKPNYKSKSLGGNSNVNNYNFGNIELPNVTNADRFISELKALVNITKHQ